MIKKLLSLGIISILLLTVSCAQQKKTVKNNPKVTTTTTSIISSVSMERTACFGRCPSYKTEIFSDGTVKYTSRNFTTYEGIYTSTIDQKDVAKLFAEFEANKVDTCSGEYQSMVADAPGIIYHIKRGDKDQEIMNAEVGPSFLRDLADRIDKLATPDDSWKKLSESKN